MRKNLQDIQATFNSVKHFFVNLYPLKFQPILKDKIWGGQKLKSLLYKDSNLPNIGESWEISDVEGDTSIVMNGPLEGQSLKDLLKSYGAELVGLQNHRIHLTFLICLFLGLWPSISSFC